MGLGIAIGRFLGYEKEGNTYFYEFGNADSAQNYSYLDAFLNVPELNAVINWKASAFRNAKIVIANKDGDVIDEDPKLFKQPNYFQGAGEFLRQTKLWHEIYGNEYLYFLSGLNSKNPDQIAGLHTLPPNLVDIEIDNTTPFWLTPDLPEVKYAIDWNGKEIHLDVRNLIHLNDNRIDVCEDDFLFGTSKIASLEAPINNMIAAYEARGINLRERGPKGILSNVAKDGVGSIPMRPGDKEEVQNEFKKYGMLKGQKRAIITNASLSWQKMGSDVSELRAFEEVNEDSHRICDAYGLSIDLFSREKGSTFENKKQAEKAAYQNTIIPEMSEWLDAINGHFNMKDNRMFVAKWDHLAVFQADKNESATALNSAVSALNTAFQSGIISKDEYREQLDKYML